MAKTSGAGQPLGRIGPGLRILTVLAVLGAALLMVGAVFGGLTRLGIPIGGVPPVLSQFHGPLMVSAFFGTVISLERSVAVRRRWSYLPPVTAALGGLCLVTLDDVRVSAVLFTAASLATVFVFGYLLARRYEPFTLAMGLGAVAWTGGNLLWLVGKPIPEVVPWYAGFLVLTIAGERLELSRFIALERSKRGFWLGFGAVGLGLVVSLFNLDAGVRAVGLGFVALAAWLVRGDVARATIRCPGAPRFMAIALFAGYVWLTVTGMLAVVHGGVRSGFAYDATWHALFLGFVFSMVFAHAQVILPALTGLKVLHGARFYLPLAILHIATVLRIAGDLAASVELRQWAGGGNAVALAVFALTLGSSIRRRAHAAPDRTARAGA